MPLLHPRTPLSSSINRRVWVSLGRPFIVEPPSLRFSRCRRLLRNRRLVLMNLAILRICFLHSFSVVFLYWFYVFS
ncbi:hypothetical protein MUK42_16672 [Musa troglodytarum]|uniref:Transmembrane protein n=1 Tax=Musa troglodytarum TaxID=320322 RepID=A0A9E7L8X2_9LILI|nr:hypothetical protein MUK42_16672 [Musa troglodytarum]